MKQTLFLAIVFAISNLSAQTEKGNYLLSGQFGFSSQNSSNDYTELGNPSIYRNTNQNIELNLGLAYFIMNNLAIGIGPSYSRYSGETSQTFVNNASNSTLNNQISRNILMLIFLRKYIPLNNQFSFYGQLDVGGGPSMSTYSYKSNNYEQNTETKGNRFRVGISGGAAWFPSKKIGLNVGIGNLGWSTTTSKTESKQNNQSQNNTYKSNTFNFNLNTAALQIGLSYFFGR